MFQILSERGRRRGELLDGESCSQSPGSQSNFRLQPIHTHVQRLCFPSSKLNGKTLSLVRPKFPLSSSPQKNKRAPFCIIFGPGRRSSHAIENFAVIPKKKLFLEKYQIFASSLSDCAVSILLSQCLPRPQ